MKKSKFLIIFIVVIVFIISLWIIVYKKGNQKTKEETIEEKQDVVLADYIEHLENGTLSNTSEKLKESKEIEGIKIDNIKITSEDITKDKVALIFNIENISNVAIGEKEVALIMYNFEHNEIGRAEVGLPNLNVSQIVTIQLDVTAEFINTYDISVVKNDKIKF